MRPGIVRRILPVLVVILGFGFSILPLSRGQFFFSMDNAGQNYPQTAFLHDALRHHVIPQWWSEIGFGSPVVAEGQAAHFNPPRLLLAYLFDAPTAFMLEVGLRLALSGLGVYLYLRGLRVLPLACFAGAVGFMFGSQCIVYVRSMSLLRASCLLPWFVWLAERYLQRRRLLDLVWLALITGLQWLGGNPTYAMICAIAGSLYLLFGHLCRLRLLDLRALVQSFAGWAGAIALGVAIAGIQVFPTLLHLPESVRADGFSVQYAAGSLRAHWKDLPQVFFPYVYDLGDLTAEGRFNPAAISGFYVGAILAVAALALPFFIRRRSDRAVPLMLTGIVTVLLALGSATPLYPLLARLPILGSFRFPVRYLLWSSFCVSCLGAIAIHRLVAFGRMLPRRSIRRPAFFFSSSLLLMAAVLLVARPARLGDVTLCVALLAVSGLLLALLFLSRVPLSRSAVLAVIGLLVVGDLLYFRLQWNYAATAGISATLRKDAIAGWLAHDRDQFRVLAIGSDTALKSNFKDTLILSSPYVWGVRTTGFSFSLGLKRYSGLLSRLTEQITRQPIQAASYANFLDFMRVKYVVAPPGVRIPGWEAPLKTAERTVWRNPRFQTAGFLVSHTQPEAQSSEAAPIDYRETAVVASTSPPIFPQAGPVTGKVDPLPASYDSMAFRVASSSPALLVLPENYYPGWSVTINGKPARLYRVNWVGIGVPVGTGNSLVSLHFETPGFRTGFRISVLALLFWAGLLIAALRKDEAGERQVANARTTSARAAN